MFIEPALAQTTTAPGGGNILLQLMPFILIFAIMYFLIIRPQQKRLKAHREMVANVKRGDTVVTAGGLVGKVVSVVDDDEIRVDIADGVRVSVVRNTLSEVRPKGEVRGAAKASREAEKTEELADESEEAEAQEEAPARAKSANGAAKKPAQRKSRSTSTSGGARKTAGGKSGTTAKSGSGSGSTRTRRSRAKSGNGASATQSKDSGGDNA
jgi:preprotein translocase subunit YajC